MSVRGDFYKTLDQVPPQERLMAVSRTPEEIAELKAAEARGELPPGTVADLKRRLEQQVFGHDVQHDRAGHPIEQGVGTVGNPSINHYNALLASEKAGNEPPGSAADWAAAVWRENPEGAKANRIPRPDKRGK